MRGRLASVYSPLAGLATKLLEHVVHRVAKQLLSLGAGRVVLNRLPRRSVLEIAAEFEPRRIRG